MYMQLYVGKEGARLETFGRGFAAAWQPASLADPDFYLVVSAGIGQKPVTY